MIVSCAHDRNAYVWKLNAEGVWEPMLVLLLLNRAALTVQWSPKGNKFAAGSGANSVCICYYQEANNWWLTKKITKKHSSSVLSVAWHPNNVLLATTSSDNKCRVFAVYVKGVDAAEDAQESVFGELKFGEPVLELDAAVGWVHSVRWSPSGTKLAYTAHDSSVYYVNSVGPSAKVQALRLPYLPLRDLLWLSENRLVAVGYDCELLLFGVNAATGQLSLLEAIDQVAKSAGGKAGSQFTAAFEKFHIQDTKGQETSGGEAPPTTQHLNCISCIRSLAPPGSATVKKFSTSGSSFHAECCILTCFVRKGTAQTTPCHHACRK
eukprot:jgi/Mesvir1/18941/Mv18913-RA.2